MVVKINCIWNDQGPWCKNKTVKRSLFGLGARCCTASPYGKGCTIQEMHPRPPAPPPCPKKRIIREDVVLFRRRKYE